MDNVISEANDVMVNQLNFGLPETSQYITDRRFVNYFPSGSNVFAPNAGKPNTFTLAEIATNIWICLLSGYLQLYKTLMGQEQSI